MVEPWAALVTGALGGLVYYGCSKALLYRAKVDDPLDAVAVHAGCGLWGLIAAGGRGCRLCCQHLRA